MGVLGTIYNYKNKKYVGVDNIIYTIFDDSSDLLGNSLKKCVAINKIKISKTETEETFGYIKDDKIISTIQISHDEYDKTAVKDNRIFIKSLFISEELKEEEIKIEIIKSILSKYINRQFTVIVNTSDDIYKIFEKCGFKKFKTINQDDFSDGKYDLLFRN